MAATVRMRPEFEIEIDGTGEEFLTRLREHLAEQDRCVADVFRRHAMIQPREQDRSFWSPYLNLELRQRDGRWLVHGRFSPHPSVWTAFMTVYGTLIFVALVGIAYGWSQVMLDRTPWALSLVPGAAVIGGFVYGAAFIGQGLGAEQMYELRAFIDGVVRAGDR